MKANEYREWLLNGSTAVDELGVGKAVSCDYPQP
jgi:hypothetical protein